MVHFQQDEVKTAKTGGSNNLTFQITPEPSLTEYKVKVEQTDINMSGDENNTETPIRRPVLKKALLPCLLMMKICGLYGINRNKRGKWAYWIHHVYMLLVNLIIISAFVFNIKLLWYSESTNDYYMVTILVIYGLKSVIQGLTLLRICHTNHIFEFIKNLENFLKEIKLQNCSVVECRFLRKCWANFVINIVGILLFTIAIVAMAFGAGTSQVDMLMKKFLSTASNGIYFKTIADIMLLTAWITPVALCVVLINSLTYTFKEFYRYVELTKQKDGICRKMFLRDVRRKFLRLTDLCGDFDNLMSLMMMFSYFIDIVMVCLILRMVVFAFTDIPSRLSAIAWLCLPVFSLMTLSKRASDLYDTGETMRKVIQELQLDNLTLDDKVELDLLMFHIGSEPVVMTIWKMIPLNRSIIVSIFVSILTYFAMLIS
eukprot:TCONS_00035065-protein